MEENVCVYEAEAKLYELLENIQRVNVKWIHQACDVRALGATHVLDIVLAYVDCSAQCIDNALQYLEFLTGGAENDGEGEEAAAQACDDCERRFGID